MTDLTKAHTLLVVPSDDLRGMLDEGPCGFRPPRVVQNLGRWKVPSTEDLRWFLSRCLPVALVLRWEGRDMPHGWLAAGMATGVAVTLHSKGPSAGQAVWLGLHLRALREAGCTLIALDEQGKEVTK